MTMVRTAMRKIREMLRLRSDCGLSYEEIGRSVNTVRSTVGDFVTRFKASGLIWPLSEDMYDITFEQRLYHPAGAPTQRSKPLPVWTNIHAELRKKSVTKQLLWIEYKASCPDGYEYTQFCTLYQRWRKSVDLSFRNEYQAGEKCFVDYAGQKVAVNAPETGQVRHANIFIAVMGASNYVFAEATWTQNLADWVGSNARGFAFFGGVPAIIVPDNLKSAVHKPCRYDPQINPTYYEMARHYGCAIIPARFRRPKDKAKAETGVLIVERWILAVLRHRMFFSLAELNAAISEPLEKLNTRPFRKLAGNRQLAFDTIDKPAIKPLPIQGYELAELKIAPVNINYHIEFDHAFYSVPYQLVRKEVTV